MKRFFNIYLGRLADRSDDEFLGCLEERVEVRPDALRWFGGTHDLDATFICQAL